MTAAVAIMEEIENYSSSLEGMRAILDRKLSYIEKGGALIRIASMVMDMPATGEYRSRFDDMHREITNNYLHERGEDDHSKVMVILYGDAVQAERIWLQEQGKASGEELIYLLWSLRASFRPELAVEVVVLIPEIERNRHLGKCLRQKARDPRYRREFKWDIEWVIGWLSEGENFHPVPEMLDPHLEDR